MKPYSRENPYLARLKDRYILNKKGSSKRTYHIVLEMEKDALSFCSGDSIGVFPENDPEIVKRILQSLGKSGEEEVFDKRTKKPYSLEDFLKKKANLTKCTTKLFAFIHTAKEDLLLPENKADLMEYLSEYDVWDLLEEHKKEGRNSQEFVDLLLPQMPRFYSIASSPKKHTDEIHLTVAELTYYKKGHPRYGIASRYLSHLVPEKGKVPIYIHPSNGFCPPLDEEAAVIMIGPGTGIAPFRAFLQERTSGKNWLFFGERHSAFDFYYEEDFQTWEKEGKLRLNTAFSRDQEEKIYVQHKMLENSSEIYRWIQEGAYIYVCGDAKKMAKDVEQALRTIIREEGKMLEEEASAFLKAMRKDKKYLLDVY